MQQPQHSRMPHTRLVGRQHSCCSAAAYMRISASRVAALLVVQQLLVGGRDGWPLTPRTTAAAACVGHVCFGAFELLSTCRRNLFVAAVLAALRAHSIG